MHRVHDGKKEDVCVRKAVTDGDIIAEVRKHFGTGTNAVGSGEGEEEEEEEAAVMRNATDWSGVKQLYRSVSYSSYIIKFSK